MTVSLGSILLSAGRGRRMQPLSDRIPKPALPLLDVPLGAFGLRVLEQSVPPVLVNVSHLSDQVINALEPYGTFDVLVERPEGLGSAGTLAALRDRIEGRVVTWNCDIVTDLEPAQLVAAHFEGGRPVTAAVRPVTSRADLIIERGEPRYIDRRQRDLSGMQFIGACVIGESVVNALPLESQVGLAEYVLKPYAERSELALHVHRGYYLDVGTFERYLSATLDLLDGRGPRAPIPSPGEIRQVPGGRAYVGVGAEVADASLGPGAVVLAGAHVDRGAQLERTIVMPGSKATARQYRDEIVYDAATLS